jgi:hypothetical protein
MTSVTVRKYTFKPPQEISEIEYHSYKQMLMVDYDADICPKEIPTSQGLSAGKIAKWSLMPLVAILAPAVLIAEAQSEMSRSKAKKAMSRFYNEDLKDLIFKSYNYRKFNEDYKKYFELYLKIHHPY